MSRNIKANQPSGTLNPKIDEKDIGIDLRSLNGQYTYVCAQYQ